MAALACGAPLVAAAAAGRRAPAPARARPAAPLRTRCAAPRRAARRATLVRAVLDVGEANFEAEVLQAEVPVLVDVWATWCGPCKLMAPLMTWAEKEYGAATLKVVKIEADPNPALIEKYKVYGLPCFLIFKGGELVEGSHSEGAMPKKQLVEYLASHGISVPAQV